MPHCSGQDNSLPDVRTAPGKFIALDALRGMAAFVVFVGHFCDGLVPAISTRAAGTPLYTALNGPAAVVLFFVLSGFVLTVRPLQQRRLVPVAVMALKRWPRLAGPTTLAGLAICLAWILGAFPHAAPFLHRLPPHAPPYLFWGELEHNERLGDVLREAAWGTFVRESSQHNPVLWTMHWELLGSFLAACLAAVLLTRLPWPVRALLFAAFWVAAAKISPWLVVFPVGVAGALVHRAIGARLVIEGRFAVPMALCGLLLLSWDLRTNAGMWAWSLSLSFNPRLWTWLATQAVGASMLMAVMLYNPGTRRACTGRLGAIAGELSFPFYLVHLQVICTLGAWLYLLQLPAQPSAWTNAALFVLITIAAFLAATPLMLFDQWWIGALSRAASAATGWAAPATATAHAAGLSTRIPAPGRSAHLPHGGQSTPPPGVVPH
jgi:peptidoglycan/LPS O-acetylase OafA/YrhL